MIKKIIYTLLLIAFALNSYSQSWSRYKYELYYGIGATNSMVDVSAPKDINKQIWINFRQTVGITSNAGIRYNYGNRHALRGSIYLGQLYSKESQANEKYQYDGRKFNTFYTELSGKYEITVVKEKKRATVYRKLGESRFKNLSIPTYLFIGLGANFNIGNYSKVSTNGQYLVNESFTNFAPILPIGFGFKYKLSRLTYFNVEATWNFTKTDNIDNIKNGWIDQYQTVTFNLVHKIRQNKNGTPKLFSKKNPY
jgi:hypothetical protein